MRPLTPDAAARLMANLRPKPQHTGTPDPARRALTGQQQDEAAIDAGTAGGQPGRELLGASESLQKTLPVTPKVDPQRRVGY